MRRAKSIGFSMIVLWMSLYSNHLGSLQFCVEFRIIFFRLYGEQHYSLMVNGIESAAHFW